MAQDGNTIPVEPIVKLTTGAEYRASRQRVITLGSGLAFKIKKPSRDAYSKILELLQRSSGMTGLSDARLAEIAAGGEAALTNLTEDEQKALKNVELDDMMVLADLLIEQCFVAPKVVRGPATNDADLSLDDLDFADTIELFGLLIEWVDISPEKIKALTFRLPKSTG